jgi:hypothetical protein
MDKQIIHFGQDLDKAEFYNVILKISDITSKEQIREVWDELQFHNINIFYYDDFCIEGAFKNRHTQTLNKYRELRKIGYVHEEYQK